MSEATRIEVCTVSVPCTAGALVFSSATQTAAGKSECFAAAVAAKDERVVAVISNAGGDAVGVQLCAGSYVGARTLEAGSVAPGETSVLPVESGVCKNAEGDIVIRLVPAAGGSLSGAKIAVAQFLPAVNN